MTPPPARPPIRVGVVEDNDQLRIEMCELLAEHPRLVVVGHAADAASGLRLVEQQRPDVVVLDVGLPDRTGDELAADIAAAFPATRIVAHTAADDRSTVLAMLRAGATAFAVKGRDGNQLCDIAIAASQGHNYLDSAVAQQILPDLLEGLSAISKRPDPESHRWTRELVDEGRITMALQPIVRLDTGQVIGAEALLRTTGPDPVAPDEVFRRAEAGGLRKTLEFHAIRSALELSDRLPAGAYLSVNASPDIASCVELIELIALNRRCPIVIEITEHDRIDDYEAMSQAMAGLRRTGARIAVDDAGAGFASLQHILDLGPDIIKLDRDITRRIDQDRNRRALARALVAYAAEIRTTIVAEGIETSSELRTLEKIGIEIGQGYLLHRPSFEKIPASIGRPTMAPRPTASAVSGRRTT